MMASVIKTIKFYNGVECPVLGLGTWRGYGKEVSEAVKEALLNGYRHIDTAAYYKNENEIGQGIGEALKDNPTISRKDLFVVTKLPSVCNRPNLVIPALKNSLKRLNLNYVDLYLIHTPVSKVPLHDNIASTEGRPGDNGEDLLDTVNPVDTWKEMEKCVELGLTKSIGVSNFNSVQIQAILDTCKIKPVTNQIECHPFLPQKKMKSFCEKNGIFLTTFRPLGGQKRKDTDPSLLENETVQEIARKLGKLPSQILLRWHIQQDFIVLAKSTKLLHILSNTNIFDFSLSDDDMQELDKLESGHRYCPYVDVISSEQYPFHIEF